MTGEYKGKSIEKMLGVVLIDIPVNQCRILEAHMHAQKISYYLFTWTQVGSEQHWIAMWIKDI